MNTIDARLNRIWFGFAFLFLLLGTLPALLMRWGFLYGMPLSFGHLLHAHSHVLVLGWLNLLGVGLMCREQKITLKRLQIFLWIQVFAGLSMFAGFLYQGYGTVSIIASCIQLIGTFYFIWIYFRNKIFDRNSFFDTALWLNMISALGILGIAPAIILAGKTSEFFRLSIEFFLHFQIQGWLVTLLIALLSQHFLLKISQKQLYFWILGVVLTFGISVNYHFPNKFWLIINALGVFSQLIFVYFFVRNIFFRSQSKLIRWALLSLVAKAIMPLFALAEPWASQALSQRDTVLFYLHWVLIGVVMFGLLGLYQPKGNPIFRWGIGLFASGYLLTEILLLIGGFAQWFPSQIIIHKYEGLAYASLVMMIGIVLISIGHKSVKS